MTTQAITVPRVYLQAALLFAGKQDIRFYLNGVLVDASDPTVTRLVATDGKRLIRIDLAGDPLRVVGHPGQWILPRSFVEQLLKVSKTIKFGLELTWEKSTDLGRVRDLDTGLQMTCIEGRYPNWQSVAPLELGDTDPHPGRFQPAYLVDALKAYDLMRGMKARKADGIKASAPPITVPLVARRYEQDDTKKDGQVVETFRRHEVLAEAQRRASGCAGYWYEPGFGIVVMSVRN